MCESESMNVFVRERDCVCVVCVLCVCVLRVCVLRVFHVSVSVCLCV